MTAVPHAAEVVDLGSHIRPGDTVMWGQGPGEPRTLVEALVEQRSSFGPVNVFIGASYSGTLRPEHADYIKMIGIGGVGSNSTLTGAGSLDVVPCHVSAIPGLITSGRLAADVVLLHLSPAAGDGSHSLGLVREWLPEAIRSARVVIAEVNDRIPTTRGGPRVRADELDTVIHTSRDPVTLAPTAATEAEELLAARVAALIADRSTVQLGIGVIAPAVARALAGKRDLGLHTGTLGDWFVDLQESGALTNRYKGVDPGVSVTASIVGSQVLYDYVAASTSVVLRPFSYTHDPRVLARLENLVSVNSAIEVDLTGQVNAETVGGRHVGAVGGQVDFVRAAMLGGRSIIALPSTARQGQVSRIVGRLGDGVVTTARSDADLVVTEHGVADLRGLPLRQRALRLISVADPAFRPALTEALVAGAPLC